MKAVDQRRSKARAMAASVVPPPSERDKAAIARSLARVRDKPERPRIRVAGGSGLALVLASPHNDDVGHGVQLMDAFGTSSPDFMRVAMGQALEAMRDRDGVPVQAKVNAALALIGGAKPANEVEALLVSQMAATHDLAMTLLGRTRRADMLNQVEANGGLAVKLLRTFAMQAEALAKLQRGGGQTVRVEHVHVHPGGQAIVGNVTGSGAATESKDQPYAQSVASLPNADAPCDPLWRADAKRERVPLARHA